jgi:hypothetical protein
MDAHAVQGGHEVGRREVDPGRGIEAGHPVADPRRLVDFGLLGAEGEVAHGDHAGEAVEHLDVHPLQLARPPAHERDGGAQHDRDHRLLPAHGDALDRRDLTPCLDARLTVDDLAQLPGPGHQRDVLGRDVAAHLVVEVQRLAGGGPDLTQDRERRDGPGHLGGVEEQVGERKVRQQAPRRRQPLEVGDRRSLESDGAGELGQGGHG